MKRHLLTFLWLLLAIPVTAQPITNRPMLGPPDTVPIIRTPIYGIQVNTNGYERVRTKQIPRSVDWMNTNGFGQLVPEFTAKANDVEAMLSQIDAIYLARLQVWSACYPQATGLSQRKIIFTVEPAPINVPGYPVSQWFSGYVNGNEIHFVNLHVNSSGTFLQGYRDGFQWELNNWFACKIVGCPQGAAAELRWQNPCQ